MAKVTSKRVFAARRYYCQHPSLRTNARFQRLRKAYEARFPNRDLDYFNKKVIFRFA